MVPFLDLKQQFDSIQSELETAALRALASTQYALGTEVAAFEEEFADYVGTRRAVAVNSGTSALHLALLCAGVGPGDQVITVSSTFVATVAAIEYAGATPVFVDVEPDTLNMAPHLVEAALTPRTKAILPVHLHGHPAELAPLRVIAERHGLALIEDAAQAHGARYEGTPAGSFGDLGCFSFYPGKNLGACGEGGMVVTNDEGFAEIARSLRDWGQEKKYHHTRKGFNYRMDGMQGALLRVKLRHLEGWTEARRERARQYDRLLAGTALSTPTERSNCRHVYHVYAVRVDDRDRVQAALSERNIHTGIHYPIPVHLQPAYAEHAPATDSLPVTEAAAATLLSLPMFPELTDAQSREVVDVLQEACSLPSTSTA